MTEKKTKKRPGKQRPQKILFDRIQLEEDRVTCTVWRGERGVYVFDHIEPTSDRSPVARVYLNRRYFSGVFKTKKRRIWSGDFKVNDERIFVDFVFDKTGDITIYRLSK